MSTQGRARTVRRGRSPYATRAAVEEGIVPGGGVSLPRCTGVPDEMKLEGDQAVGVSIVKRALEEPIRQIVVNAGVEGAVIVREARKNKKASYGFNAASEEYQKHHAGA